MANIRPNQRLRTRKDLLEAAGRLMKRGVRPSLEEIAEEALVSRATAYRHFPGLEALLLEASLDITMPEVEASIAADAGQNIDNDPVARLRRLDIAFDRMIDTNEAALRAFLAHSLVQPRGATPPRQNRRSPLIAAAMTPALDAIDPASRDRLIKALAIVIGTEGAIVLKDVLEIGAEEARSIKDWMITALVEAARTSV